MPLAVVYCYDNSKLILIKLKTAELTTERRLKLGMKAELAEKEKIEVGAGLGGKSTRQRMNDAASCAS